MLSTLVILGARDLTLTEAIMLKAFTRLCMLLTVLTFAAAITKAQ